MTRLPEAALHRIWERHDLLTPHLRTTDGRRVRVIHAGTPNPDSGPDFRDAIIRIGTVTFRGDVEIHRSAAGWHLHHHDRDPRYNRVILHVVAHPAGSRSPAYTAAGRTLPLLVLPSCAAPPPRTPADRAQIIAACAATLLASTRPRVKLARLGWTRIRRKARRFENRLHQLIAEEHGIIAETVPGYDARECVNDTGTGSGAEPCARTWAPRTLRTSHLWEQLVYEGVMEAMGYARNSDAFLLLSRTVTLRMLRTAGCADPDAAMGLLFGTAGLLPTTGALNDSDAVAYVRRLHRHWGFAAVPPGPQHAAGIDWVFFRLRPANFPTARIAAVAHLLPTLFAPARLCALFRDTVRGPGSDRERLRRLRSTMRIAPEGYWAHHLHFHDRWKERGVRLGNDRITIIMLNALLPVALAHARIVRDGSMERRLRRLARALPPPHEPRMCREIREHTGGTTERLTAVEQEGLIELMKREGRRKREG